VCKRGLKPKDASKDILELAEVKTLLFSTFSLPYKRMPSIGAVSLRIPLWRPTLNGLDLPLASLVSITGKRKILLTCI
jgi:hypothetical protein